MYNRNHYFDFLRGIAILMVVGIHTYIRSNFDSIEGISNIIIRESLNFAVPLFLAISGFFLGKKDLSTKDNVIMFWKKQIPKVYLPCIVWSLPLFALAIYHGGNMLENLILLFCCGYSVYYFIALIIQCYALLPLLLKFNRGG
jgi:surface polysaccharide O-acyltransferase-like enzyme